MFEESRANCKHHFTIACDTEGLDIALEQIAEHSEVSLRKLLAEWKL